MITKEWPVTRRCVLLSAAAILGYLFAPPVFAQTLPSQAVVNQIGTLLQEKASRTALQQKLNSHLWYALQASRGRALAGLSEVFASAKDAVAPDASGRAKVDISAAVSDDLLDQIRALGGSVLFASAQDRSILAIVPLTSLERLAADPNVVHIAPAARGTTNVGALTSQGYISHKANQVVSSLGEDGTGVKVGVLSDSVDALAALIATGDLPAGTTVVPGQSGNPGTSEGTAMMEIVHDLAPGAQLFFATAFNGIASFADNIRTLRNTYGCDIIVDDVTYFNEGVFQDGPIAQAVNDVVASGALYFSVGGQQRQPHFGDVRHLGRRFQRGTGQRLAAARSATRCTSLAALRHTMS